MCLLLSLLICTGCISPAFAHDIYWSDEWTYDRTYHWHDCNMLECSIKSPEDKPGYGYHTFSPGGICSVCHYNRNVKLAPNRLAFVHIRASLPYMGQTEWVSNDGEGYRIVGTQWTPVIDRNFEQNTIYTLEVVIRTDPGYKIFIKSPPLCFVNGEPAIIDNIIYVIDSDEDEAVITFTFPKIPPCHLFDEGIWARAEGMNTVKVTWNSSLGADGYLVLRDGGQIGFCPGHDNCSFLDTNASSEKYNFYWVIPYTKRNGGPIKKGKLSNYVWAIGRTIGKVPGFKAGAGSHLTYSIGLRWDMPQGANSFVILSKEQGQTHTNAPIYTPGCYYDYTTGVANKICFFWIYGIYRDSSGKIMCAGPISDYIWGISSD